jgi:23S rRNA (adenine2503-C2)-methyltransferase
VLALQAFTPDKLAREHPQVLLREARKIVSAVHKGDGIDGPVRETRRVTLEYLRATFELPTLEVVTEQRSAVDPFRKLLFRTPDDKRIEAVRIPLEKTGRFSACVSSQVGCALACTFCATGRLGLLRNLEVWEIVEQVRALRRTLDVGQRIHGVVFQGMGEPMANLDRVLAAIEVLTDPCAQSIDGRAITVCTSGLPAGIRRLALEAPKVRLGLSIGSAIPEARRRLMPIEAAHSLDEVLDAAVEHAKRTGYAPMWALTLLAGVNDSPEHARALAARARDFEARAGLRPRISIIPYNAIGDGDPFDRSSPEAEAAFRDAMVEAGVFSKKRYSGGGDVAAACGQLAGRDAVNPR